MRIFLVLLCSVLPLSWVACGGTEADKKGIAAECASNDDCKEEDQNCLTQFRGGYCGKEDCNADSDCPSGSICVTHTDEKNYCFRSCKDKTECNVNRSAANEANCSANITKADGGKNGKACVPPSG